MTRRLVALLVAPLLAVAACAKAAPPSKPLPPPPAPLQEAVLAGGCFWCMEHDMKGPGVVSVDSGYTGGHVASPTYGEVTSETTGHHEAVRVVFDPRKTSYGFILSRYWKLIDPTDASGQFCDRGPSYAPAVFVADAQQKKIAEETRAEAAKQLKQGAIRTPILPLGPFWPAESYHRNYAETHGADYRAYRTGCGRDQRLAQIWGGPAR
ncbi:MAG: peptide-methionine (S)-S-oxide reductase MsrA [Caulobacteraceae bacterium]|nr:peptide-methionine (S)-S-oxide reductase MsrA [Caulobacter sp.]